MRYFYTEFNIDPEISRFSPYPVPEFCRRICSSYFTANVGEGEIIKKRFDQRALYIRGARKIKALNINNSHITYWSDLWLNNKGEVIDPLIENLTLQSNLLQEFVITEERRKLRYLDLSNNLGLGEIYLPSCSRLEVVKLNKINEVSQVTLGLDAKRLKRLEMKECGVINPGVLSSFTFSSEPGFVDFTGSTLRLSEEDQEVLDFLEFNNYTVKGVIV